MSHKSKTAAFALVGFVFASGNVAAQAPDTLHSELSRLNQQVNTIMRAQPFDYTAYSESVEKARSRTYELIALDSLRTPADFYTASVLAGDPSGFYEYRRVEHELALVALVLKHPDAMKRVGLSWDGLNWSFGRGQRIGTMKRNGVAVNMDPTPSPVSVATVFTDLPAAFARARHASNDAELEALRVADQADREPPLDAAKMQRMNENDPRRRARVLEKIAAGRLATGRDLHNAALILQHAHTVDDFRLAHELSIAAVALGDTSAIWLLSRTYDRMLLHLGHRQRLNTQYGGAKQSLLPLDTVAVNDRIRRSLGSRELAKAQNRPQ